MLKQGMVFSMKKAITLILTLMLILSLAACSKGGDTDIPDTNPAESKDNVTKTGDMNLKSFESYFSDSGKKVDIISMFKDGGFVFTDITGSVSNQTAVGESIEAIDFNESVYECTLRFLRRIVNEGRDINDWDAVFSISLNAGITGSDNDYETKDGKPLSRTNMKIDAFQTNLVDRDSLTLLDIDIRSFFHYSGGEYRNLSDDDLQLVQLVGPEGRPEQVTVLHLNSGTWEQYPMYLMPDDKLVMEKYKLYDLYNLFVQFIKQNDYSYDELKATFDTIPLNDFVGRYEVSVYEGSMNRQETIYYHSFKVDAGSIV